MNWKSRLRLFLGIIGVVILLGALTLLLNYSMTHIPSRSAQLMSDMYTVGTDYSGIVTKQYVSQGEHVSAGQPLFVIKSSVLDSDLSGELSRENLAYTLDEQNQIILKAVNAGVVSSITYLEGAFVPANKEVATVTRDNSLYITGKYDLSPPDYARVKNGDYVTVTLPNNQKVTATIFNVSVENNGNSLQAIVKARLNNAQNIAFTSGTPVSSELQLNGKSWYDSLSESIQKLFQPRA